MGNTLIKLGFTIAQNPSTYIPEDQLQMIRNIDEAVLLFDESEGSYGGHLAIQFSNPGL